MRFNHTRTYCSVCSVHLNQYLNTLKNVERVFGFSTRPSTCMQDQSVCFYERECRDYCINDRRQVGSYVKWCTMHLQQGQSSWGRIRLSAFIKAGENTCCPDLCFYISRQRAVLMSADWLQVIHCNQALCMVHVDQEDTCEQISFRRCLFYSFSFCLHLFI